MFLAGQSDDVGNFLLRVSSDDYGQIASKPITRVAKVGVGSSWKMKEVYRQALDQDQETIDDPNIYMYEYNIQSQRAVLLSKLISNRFHYIALIFSTSQHLMIIRLKSRHNDCQMSLTND